MSPVVYAFCRESGERFRPSIGRGASQERPQWYNRPTHTGSTVQHIGEGFHANWLPAEGLLLVEVDADHWKTWVHERLRTPLGNPGAMTFYQASPQEHLALAKHLTAETKFEEFVAERGAVVRWRRLRRQTMNGLLEFLLLCVPVVRWRRLRRQNHWLDCLYNASAAGYACGVRLLSEQAPEVPKRHERPSRPFVRRDGSPWIDLERWRQSRRF